MVNTVSSRLSMSELSTYSMGSYTQIDKTDTEVFEDVFQDAMESVGMENQKSRKIDESQLGMPLGMQIEDVSNSKTVQSASAGNGSSGGTSSDSKDEDYDEMDTNQDGVVSTAERIAYEAKQATGSSSDNSIVDMLSGASSISSALSAYSVA